MSKEQKGYRNLRNPHIKVLINNKLLISERNWIIMDMYYFLHFLSKEI
jgi:hypothetical protein